MTTFLLLTLLSAAPPPSVGVMDFAAQGASPELTAATCSLAAHELERLGTFKVSSAEMTRFILGVERQRQLLGCEDCSGSALSDLTSLEYLVTGRLARAGEGKGARYVLLVTLLKTGSSAPLSSVRAEATGEEALLQEVGPSMVKLVGKLLEGRQGALVVTSTEVGAAVKVDDTQVGTTPLPGKLPLAAGPHLVSVEKDGFSAVRKEVRIAADQVSEEAVRLVPSPDTIRAYESRATSLRVLAWVATGLAVAGVGTAVGAGLYGSQLYGSPTAPGTFEYHRAFLQQGLETSDGVDHRAAANELKSQLELTQTLTWVGAGAAAAGALGATVLFVVGDPPGRYDAFREVKVEAKPTVSVAPTLGGLMAFGRF